MTTPFLLIVASLPLDVSEAKAHFQKTVRPLIVKKCLECHGSRRPRGGLDLSTRKTLLEGGKTGAVVVPGSPEKSLLLQKIRERKMPPKDPLSSEQIETIEKWIANGLPYTEEPLKRISHRAGKDWWSLQPLRSVSLPSSDAISKTNNPIDLFIHHRLRETGLRLSPEAERAALIRRATFDLHGLPPTPEEVEAFVSDPDPIAYEKLIDRLLASPRYGERWARHWLDVVRFAESHGYETNQLRMNAWPYRDYVIRAFNRDIPYPQFILEQLAGDTIAGADQLTQAATGFLVGGAHDVVGNQSLEGRLQQRMDDLDDMITATASTFLGLTVHCARCHDHKFDPILQKDYYSFQAVFAGIQHAERDLQAPPSAERAARLKKLKGDLRAIEQKLDQFEPFAQPLARRPVRAMVDPCCNVERFTPTPVKWLRFTILATNNRTEPCIDELEIYTAGENPQNVALASAGAKATVSSVYPNNPRHKREHIHDGRHGNGRSWISRERDRGWVEIELAKPYRIDRVLWGRDREEKYRDRLPTDYRIEVAHKPGQWHLVASSHDRQPYRANAPKAPLIPPGLTARERYDFMRLVRQRESLLQQIPKATPSMRSYVGTFQQPGPTHLLLRGDPLRKGEEVAPAGVSVINPSLQLSKDTSEPQRRVRLAKWLGSSENPLTARVMANRLWHYHFGQGIVKTPSDFGFNGSRPSHPDLLDWLSKELIRKGWKLKPLHRMILLSATYRQSSKATASGLAKDRQNQFLWRMSPRRLEAEAIRDSILRVSGQLNLKMGGPGYNLWQKNTNYVTVFKPKLVLGPEEQRRMVYQFKPRSQQDPIFGVFDCPDAALARPRRTVSTTVLQALNLLNSQFLLEQSRAFAMRIQREAGEEVQAQIIRAFQLAYGRKPFQKEQKAAIKVAHSHGLPAVCRALLNSNEFLYVD